MTDDDADFYASIPVFDDFADAVKPENYRPLPDDWVVGVFRRRRLDQGGRRRGATRRSTWSAPASSPASPMRCGGARFPFVFGGDGASFAVARGRRARRRREALAAMAVFAREEYQIELRVAMVPVGGDPRGGARRRVARYGASPALRLRDVRRRRPCLARGAAPSAGTTRSPPAAPGARPDLTDLSCRWGVAPARHGLILSVIVAPRGDDPRFRRARRGVVRHGARRGPDGGRPITLDDLSLAAPAEIALEAVRLEAAAVRALAAGGVAAAAFAPLRAGRLFHTLRLRAGEFDSDRSTPATSPPTPIFASSTTACG